MYDLIVVGGGPAGLTATIYAIRKRIKVLMVTKNLGGKTNFRLSLPWIEDYQIIRGLEVVNKFRSELEYLNFARHMESVDRVIKKEDHFIVRTKGGGEISGRTVIIATGAKQQLLHIPGEKEYMMRGLCYSAISYAPLFIDRTATVIGDAKLALRAAAELATVASQVKLVGPTGEVLNTPLGKKLSAAENVTLFEGYETMKVVGDEFAHSIVVKDAEGQEQEITSDGIFIEKALIPHSDIVGALVELDKDGRIVVDCDCRTNVPGIFAAGDVTHTLEQVLIAVGEGAKAALSAYEYLLPTL
jgi:alkyl hydroperoxide reductase subunit F